MIALDTNVLVRFLTRDDEAQFQLAREVMAAGELWLSKTVLLETEWVLRHAYGLDREAMQRVLARLLGYPALRVESRDQVRQAVVWHAQGLDFADALHLASSGEAEEMVTFDRRFAGRRAELEGGAVVRWLG